VRHNFELDRPLSIVTGGSGDIGRAIVHRLDQLGYNVLILDVTAPDYAHTSAVDYLYFDALDMSKIPANVSYMLNTYGTPEILIHCSGINQTGVFDSLGAQMISSIIAVNFTSVILLTREFVKSMSESSKAKIVFITSRLASLRVANNAVYSATKAGILTFCQQIALEYGVKGLRANSISPGLIATKMNEATRSDPKKLNSVLSRQSIDRIGQPNDIADMVEFLCSEKARFISGDDFRVDGGFF